MQSDDVIQDTEPNYRRVPTGHEEQHSIGQNVGYATLQGRSWREEDIWIDEKICIAIICKNVSLSKQGFLGTAVSLLVKFWLKT